jgi:hypothetical protein
VTCRSRLPSGRLREKVQREREARREASTRDYTKYTVVTPRGRRERLPKRRAMLEVVKGLTAAGVPIAAIQQVLQTEHSRGPPVGHLFGPCRFLPGAGNG